MVIKNNFPDADYTVQLEGGDLANVMEPDLELITEPELPAHIEPQIESMAEEMERLKKSEANAWAHHEKLKGFYIKHLHLFIEGKLDVICVVCGLKGDKARECDLKECCTLDFCEKEDK